MAAIDCSLKLGGEMLAHLPQSEHLHRRIETTHRALTMKAS